MTLGTETEVNLENSKEGPKTPRNFRTAIDIENFYRFVNDNDLRKEAKIMLELIQQKVLQTVKKKKKETKALNKKNLH
jgi:geranylgeranyl pyrophosphate synthase